MELDSQRLLSDEERKSEHFSDIETESTASSFTSPKPQSQRWTTKFILLQLTLIALYTLISVLVSYFHIQKALSSHSTPHV